MGGVIKWGGGGCGWDGDGGWGSSAYVVKPARLAVAGSEVRVEVLGVCDVRFAEDNVEAEAGVVERDVLGAEGDAGTWNVITAVRGCGCVVEG